jgi:hypothetical protein
MDGAMRGVYSMEKRTRATWARLGKLRGYANTPRSRREIPEVDEDASGLEM